MLQFYDFEVKKKLNKELRKEQALGGWGTTQTRSSSWERMLKVRAACKKTTHTHTHHRQRDRERDTHTHKIWKYCFPWFTGQNKIKAMLEPPKPYPMAALVLEDGDLNTLAPCGQGFPTSPISSQINLSSQCGQQTLKFPVTWSF